MQILHGDDWRDKFPNYDGSRRKRPPSSWRRSSEYYTRKSRKKWLNVKIVRFMMLKMLLDGITILIFGKKLNLTNYQTLILVIMVVVLKTIILVQQL